MDLIELGSVLGSFFDEGAGPTHDQLDQSFLRWDLQAGDPAPGGRMPGGKPMGKSKRIRNLLVFATDSNPLAGLEVAKQIVSLCRADGLFMPSQPTYVGSDKVDRLAAAFDRLGFTLSDNGQLRQKVIDNLSGRELTAALREYVDRINLNPDDAALQVGSGKELDEATARHVLEQRIGSYPTQGRESHFPFTLAQAFSLVGFSVPAEQISLDRDPHKAVQQSLFILATSVNRLRNEVGTGHGRPSESQKTPPLTSGEARLVARATALVSGALLDQL